MRILFQSRRTLFTVPGGDTVQVVKTAEHIRKLGASVDISTDLEPDVTRYDLVHLFNLSRPQETYLQAVNAKRAGRKVALSTIHVSFDEADRMARRGLQALAARILSQGQREYAKVAARALLNREWSKGALLVLSCGFRQLQRKILNLADVLLPNSDSEMRRLLADFPDAREKPRFVVPNAIDTALFGQGREGIRPLSSALRDYVLCVARLEPLKGQLELALAMRDLPWPLLLVGRVAPNHEAYLRKIREASGGNVHVIGEVRHEALPAYYAGARVHALASWFETTGLSSLEAGAMGCRLVITDKGDTRDYFGDLATYCDPGSVESVRSAIQKAHASPWDPRLRDRILGDFTWEKCAARTLEAYAAVV